MPFSIPVTLTSPKNPSEQRHLTLTHLPTLIGRASKSESKNLQPSSTNGLFDCPVISREHAELQVDQSKPYLEQIKIMDKGSMHGTWVNGQKLKRYEHMTLRSGDLLQFGTRVTRGSGIFDLLNTSLNAETKSVVLDTHDGVYVKFERDPSTITKRGYRFPESDVDSDIGEDGDSLISDISDDDDEVEEVSSAKTTPEQPKSQPGSAQRPIDLTNIPPLPRSNIIDLVDEGRDVLIPTGVYPNVYRPASPTLLPRRNLETVKYKLADHDETAQSHYQPAKKNDKSAGTQLVQDSIDKDVEVLVPESAPLERLHSAGDDESVLNHNTGLTGLLNNRAKTSSERGEDEVESFNLDHEDMEEDENDEEEYDEEADPLSESDASDLYDEMRDEDYDEWTSYSAKKHASPELPSTIPAKPATSAYNPPKAAQPWTYPDTFKHTTFPYYDPVRASQPPLAASQPLPTKLPSSSTAQTYRPYTYAAPPVPAAGAPLNVHTDLSNSSRWDIPPAPYAAPVGSFGPAPLTGRPYVYGCDYNNLYPEPQSFGNVQPLHFSPAYQSPVWEGPSADFSRTTVEASWSKQPAVEPAASKKLMKISDMVEKAGDAATEGPVMTPDKATATADAIVAVSGKKRKADAIDSFGAPSITLDSKYSLESEDAMQEDTLNTTITSIATNDIQEPPAQRRKIEQAAATTTTTKASRSVVGDVAKYATAAAVGGVSTMAFLCSPLAERMLEWLA